MSWAAFLQAVAQRSRPSHCSNAVIFNVQPARLPGREGAAENQISLGREMPHIISAYILLARGRSMGPAREKWTENNSTWLESHNLTVTIPYRRVCIFVVGYHCCHRATCKDRRKPVLEA